MGKENLYDIQFKRRLEDKQIGGLLKIVCSIEKIIVMNSGQFVRFYKDVTGEDLGLDVTLEEINILKMQYIRVIFDNVSAFMKDNPNEFNEELFNNTTNF